MGKGGRPRKLINWDEFDKLVSFQCTQEEIAAFFDCDVDTVNAACLRDRGESFSDIWTKKKLFGRVRLRKAQFAIVEKGGPGAATMAIFLDKKLMPEEQPRDPPPGGLLSPPGPQSSPPGKKTFVEFCTAAGYPAPFAKQIEMQLFGFSETDPRILLGSRGYGKTDYVTILGTAYDVYCNWFDGLHLNKETASTTLIISKSRTRNTAMIEQIAEALTSNGVPLEKENATCVRVEGLKGKDHSVEVLTIKSSFRGRHPKRIIMDDPVTEEDISEAMRLLVKRKYDEAYKLCKNVVVIGQPAHAFDLYAELRPILRKMEVPHGMIPELDADLEAMRLAGVDQHSIEMSYHLKIPKDGTTPFASINWLDRFPSADSAVAFIDPSDGGDFTAITILKKHFDGVAIVGGAWQRAWYLCMDEMVPMMRAFGVKKLCFETNATGTQPLDQLRANPDIRTMGIGVVGKHSDTNKEACIMAAGSYSHLIHLSRESNRAYTDQVVKYAPKPKYDDAPDSLARCLEWVGLIRGKR